jgi:uncharacterized membrane protein
MWSLALIALALGIVLLGGTTADVLIALALVIVAARLSGTDRVLAELRRALGAKPAGDVTGEAPTTVPAPPAETPWVPGAVLPAGQPEPEHPAPPQPIPAYFTGTIGAAPPPTTSEEPPGWSMADFARLEKVVAGRGLAIAGGAALIMGAVFFLGLAFTRGWIGPELRVIIGLIAGVGLFGLGAWLFTREQAVVAHVLVAVGLGVFSLALFAAARLYFFISPELGVAAALVAAVAAAVLAIRANAQLIAGFGLIAVLASPPVMGASANLTTLFFLGAALIGTTAVSLYRTWPWLPTLGFWLAVPQFAVYLLGDPAVGVALPALAVFWALNAAAAAGEELLDPRDRLSPSSAMLLLANAGFLVWGGFELLWGDLEPWRGLFLLAAAAAHGGLAAFFLRRGGLWHPFGMLAAGTGVAALTLAVPIQVGKPWIPFAWAAEAVALTWVYAARRHIFAGMAAVVLGALGVGYVASAVYPIGYWTLPASGAIPFVNSNGAALAFVLVAGAAAAWLVRERPLRMTLAAVGGLLVLDAAPFELSGVWLVALVAIVGVAAALLERRWLGVQLIPKRIDPMGLGDRALYAVAGVAALIIAGLLPIGPLAPDSVVRGLGDATLRIPGGAFLNEASLSMVIAVASALAVALTAGGRLWRQVGLLVAAAGIGYLMASQTSGPWTVFAWLALAIGLHLASDGARLPYLHRGAMALAALAGIETIAVVAPPFRLVVRPAFAEPMLANGGILAVLAVMVALAVRAYLPPRGREARWAALAAGVAGVYLLSIATVDVFQAQLAGPIALEELQKQAQVALSVLWAVIGVAALTWGLTRNRPDARVSGLALLTVVTAKVFVVDLAALDVAYRVLSFVALGVLLLGAAYLYRRLEGRSLVKPEEPRPS